MKLNIEIYGVTDIVRDNQLVTKSVEELKQLFSKSFMKNKVSIRYIDLAKEPHNKSMVEELLGEGLYLPWTMFNGEIMFYSGFSIPMIYEEAARQCVGQLKK